MGRFSIDIWHFSRGGCVVIRKIGKIHYFVIPDLIRNPGIF
ncbi:hypothetical protein D3OALGA1CA_4502 [Olavius algarvensis associated proteobacterium Delta 3]|nr:hypothetical protein D3OALGB2SA_2363 [Olavius algarvensis associated proteobacterium Delta 3]CAB5152316.1 hypothetical protein D3OALGA1CA_4502 [Olavius algarvensis associated proteobacterium Delta 3]